MLNSIIESISAALNAEFGGGYKIYREAKRQGLQEPCFFIQSLNPTEKLFLGKRHFRQSQFCVQYFPKDESRANEECCMVAERLFERLEWLETNDGPVMGTGMSCETADGILSFFVNYDMFVYKAAESPPSMEEVSSETSLKG